MTFVWIFAGLFSLALGNALVRTILKAARTFPRAPVPAMWTAEHFCLLCWTKWGKQGGPCDWVMCQDCWSNASVKPCPECRAPMLLHYRGLTANGTIIQGTWGQKHFPCNALPKRPGDPSPGNGS